MSAEFSHDPNRTTNIKFLLRAFESQKGLALIRPGSEVELAHEVLCFDFTPRVVCDVKNFGNVMQPLEPAIIIEALKQYLNGITHNATNYDNLLTKINSQNFIDADKKPLTRELVTDTYRHDLKFGIREVVGGLGEFKFVTRYYFLKSENITTRRVGWWSQRMGSNSGK